MLKQCKYIFSLMFFDVSSCHCKWSKKNSCPSFSLWPARTQAKLPIKSCTLITLLEAMMRSCILHRLCAIFQFASKDTTTIRPSSSSKQNTHTYWKIQCKRRRQHTDKEWRKMYKKAYKCLHPYVSHLLYLICSRKKCSIQHKLLMGILPHKDIWIPPHSNNLFMRHTYPLEMQLCQQLHSALPQK
jgi:hypothetical protein